VHGVCPCRRHRSTLIYHQHATRRAHYPTPHEPMGCMCFSCTLGICTSRADVPTCTPTCPHTRTWCHACVQASRTHAQARTRHKHAHTPQARAQATPQHSRAAPWPCEPRWPAQPHGRVCIHAHATHARTRAHTRSCRVDMGSHPAGSAAWIVVFFAVRRNEDCAGGLLWPRRL
jgi:hypothetical protein